MGQLIDDLPVRRARTLTELRQRQSLMQTTEGDAVARAFRPRPDDVLIVTYPKSGTTWMQQIVHGLRTGGSMDFDEITRVVPWIEMAHDMGLDLEADQAAWPRAFKSHCQWPTVQKGARYIYILRDPKPVAVSLYRFLEGWKFEPGTISFETFVTRYFADGSRSGRYWEHVASWWAERGRDDVLMLAYEDMLDDLAGAVRRVAAFIGLDPTAETLAVATEQATAEFMRSHERQFDDHLLRAARDAACRLPPGGDSSKVGGGEARNLMTPDLEALIDGLWQRDIAGPLGLPDYAALRASLG